jgi:hypothetical protein
MRDFRAIAVENLGQFFKRGTPRFDVEEVDKAEFDEDPDL